MPCDVLVPGGRSRDYTRKMPDKLKCRILAEGANGPTTPEADKILDQRWDEVFVIPDILCNAGGVIVSYFEWVQGLQASCWSETEVTDKLFRIFEHSFTQVIRRAKEHKISHRTAAMAIGVERVMKAKDPRPFPTNPGRWRKPRVTARLARALNRLRGNVSAVPARARAVSEESSAIFAHG